MKAISLKSRFAENFRDYLDKVEAQYKPSRLARINLIFKETTNSRSVCET